MHKPAFALIIAAIFSLPACASLRQSRQGRLITRSIERSSTFDRGFTGFYLADAQTGRTLIDINGDKLFTPASNAKILTLAVCLEVLGDSLPRYRYQFGEPPLDVWTVTGTGDPTTLHPDFALWQSAPPMMRDTGKTPVFFFSMPGTAQLPRMPSGWMWDDMPYTFSAEISELPLYGNTIEVTWTGQEWHTQPAIFQSHLKQVLQNGKDIRRSALGEEILVPENVSAQPAYSTTVPMFNPRQYALQLLSDTLHGLFLTEPEAYPYYNLTPNKRWYACPVDTAYRRMMHQSDNFFAEQLLLLSAGEKFDMLDIKLIQRWAQDSLWQTGATPLRWADGSGLSRYNLLSPRFLGVVLQQMWQRHSRERLFELFPAGGEEGTLNGWFNSPAGQAPYLYAKSGSMSGVFCLSGYLVAKSGRVLVFSCLNNNFTGNNRPWKEAVSDLLLRIRDRL